MTTVSLLKFVRHVNKVISWKRLNLFLKFCTLNGFFQRKMISFAFWTNRWRNETEIELEINLSSKLLQLRKIMFNFVAV